MSQIVSRSDEVRLHTIRPNLAGTVIEGKNLTLVRWVVEPRQDVTGLHVHAGHEQFTIVIEGSVETVVGDQRLVLSAGDVCRIEAGMTHGATRALDGRTAVLIDVFQPVREDYVALAQKAGAQ